ncbi:hypothetical protein BBJ28_00009981 [Nothophytophthora sp. Chile5]|nr:hypothetical protein BBJ28_00009981 [Nothophytophthora sp. Chile5]
MTRSLRLGDKWFLVSTDWWQRVVERGEDASASSSSDTRIRNADLVDAARSCRCCSRSLLYAGLVKSVDYRVVNERVWRALALEFGYDWEISREVVDDGHGLTIDVYPSGLQDGGGPGHTSPPAADSHRSEVAVDLSIEAMEQWRSDLKLGQLVDALDTDSKWYEARVVDLADARAKVHYRGWSAKWDEWLERTSPRLMPLHSKRRNMDASMAAFGADVAGARDDGEPNWALPNWEEYSEASRSSFVGDWSDVEPDVSVDTASSVASTEHQRVYRLQRARGGAQDRYTQRQQRDLTDLHSLYARRRQEESSMDVASANVSRSLSSTWFQPAPCVSPRVPEDEKPLSPIVVQRESEEKTVAQRELLAQQSEISAELQAVRRQLSDFQDKWKKTVESRGSSRDTGEMESDTPTASSSWSTPVVTGASTAAQTDEDGREDAVKQWLLLLTQKLDTLAGKYSHEPTQAFQAAMTHLNGLQGTQKSNEDAGNQETSSCEDGNEENGTLSPSSWHLGRALTTAVSLEVAEQFLELERAVAGVNAAVEQHERRQLTNFDRAVRQVQGYHHERLQRVVDESLAELKLVRGRYKKKESQLEEELRVANQAFEHWKQNATEAEHRKKLGEEAMTFQLTAVKEQVRVIHEHACRRYEEDTARLKSQLESLRAERLEVGEQRADAESVISQAKKKASRLEEQYKALVEQQERAKELHDREQRVLRDMIRQLREGKDEMEAQYARERQTVTTTLEESKTTQQGELKELEARVMHDTERRMLQELLPEKISSLEKRHEETINAIRSDYEQKLARLAAQLDESKSAMPPSLCAVAIETQTEATDATSRKEETESKARVDELTRRCQALEKLLDKKFEETPRSLSSSRRCESCHSDALSSSRRSSLRSDSSSIRGRASGKSRALARALLGSSRSSMEGALFTNETTLATDEATLGAQEMWDTSSFTSADTMDDLASFSSHRTTPRPPTQGTRSTQEILTLVRKLKQAASSTGDDRREPDPEVNWGTLSRQKHAMSPLRDPPSWDGESRGKANAARHIDESASGAKGTSIFDDLLASHSPSPTFGHADAHHATR